MSIWGTFKEIKVHDPYSHVEGREHCSCSDNIEVYASQAWFGYPLRLTIDNDGTHADAALTRDQVRDLARTLTQWADRDEIGDIRIHREYLKLPGFTTRWDTQEGTIGPTEADTVTFECSCGDSFHGTSTEVLEHLHTCHPEWKAA